MAPHLQVRVHVRRRPTSSSISHGWGCRPPIYSVLRCPERCQQTAEHWRSCVCFWNTPRALHGCRCTACHLIDDGVYWWACLAAALWLPVSLFLGVYMGQTRTFSTMAPPASRTWFGSPTETPSGSPRQFTLRLSQPTAPRWKVGLSYPSSVCGATVRAAIHGVLHMHGQARGRH